MTLTFTKKNPFIMRNILTIIAIATLTFISATGQAQESNQQAFISQESMPYKAIIAFNKGKKASKTLKSAYNNLKERVEGYDVQVIKAKKKFASIMYQGEVIFEVNVEHFVEAHGQGFLILSNDNAPQVFNDFDSLIVNEDTIVDIALISLGLNEYEDVVVAF